MNIRSNAKLWPQAPGPNQKYRDRQRIQLPDGTKVDLVGYGRTKTAATEDLITKARQAVLDALVDRTLTVDKAFSALMQEKRELDGRKARTIYNHEDLYKRHVQPVIGEAALVNLTITDITGIQTTLTAAGKYRTAEMATTLIKSLIRFVHRQHRPDIEAGRLPLLVYPDDIRQVKRPAAVRQKAREKEQVPWTQTELQVFLDAAKEQYLDSRAHNMYPMFLTAVGSGLRRGELLGLRRTDLITRTLEVEGKQVKVHLLRVNKQLAYYGSTHHPETPKSDAGFREVPIGDDLAACLKQHMKRLDELAAENPRWDPDSDLLLPGLHGQPLEPRNISRAKNQLIERLELPAATLHQMRAVYTTAVTQNLISQGRYNPRLVMRLLGHSTPHVALQHYTSTTDQDLAAAVFNPGSAASLDKSLDKSGNKKDALSVESAS